MNSSDPTITHIAAHPVTIGGRVIQRCAVCGAKLLDSLNVEMPVTPDGKPAVFATWAPGNLVRVDAGNPTFSRQLEHIDGDQLPDDSCIEFA